MYKCAKCGKLFELAAGQPVRCPSCAYKIIFLQREPLAKQVKAR